MALLRLGVARTPETWRGHLDRLGPLGPGLAERPTIGWQQSRFLMCLHMDPADSVRAALHVYARWTYSGVVWPSRTMLFEQERHASWRLQVGSKEARQVKQHRQSLGRSYVRRLMKLRTGKPRVYNGGPSTERIDDVCRAARVQIALGLDCHHRCCRSKQQGRRGLGSGDCSGSTSKHRPRA